MGFVPFTFVDFIDIILVAVIMYWIYRMTKGTNAPYILSGIIAIYLLWVVVRTLNMELLSTILGQLISVGAIALIFIIRKYFFVPSFGYKMPGGKIAPDMEQKAAETPEAKAGDMAE